MIKLLADENFPLVSIEILEKKKYNVLNISRLHPGISDADIVRIANQQQRLILTFDRDFGQLIFKDGMIAEHGVIYFRLQQFDPAQPAQMLLNLFEKEGFEVARTITVIEESFIRQKKF